VNAELVQRIRSVRFKPVRLREGYDMETVDQLLDQLEQAASRGLPLAPVVAAADLPRVKVREGYSIDEVAGPAASAASRTDGASGPGFPVETKPTTSVIQEQRGLISRLFRRQ